MRRTGAVPEDFRSAAPLIGNRDQEHGQNQSVPVHNERNQSVQANESRQVSYPSRLILKNNGRLTFVDAGEIDWIQAMDVYVRLHSGEKSHLVRERLKNVEEKLDPNQFMRIHRSTIVNVERIREVKPHPYGGAMAVLHDGTKLKVSRTYRTRLTPTFG